MYRYLYIPLLAFLLFSCEDEPSQSSNPPEHLALSSEYVAAFGDIQKYTNVYGIGRYQHSCDWILAQKRMGVHFGCVLHTGDVTEQNAIDEWTLFQEATQELANEIPYISMIGNHDYDWDEGGRITDRNSTHFNSYALFGKTRSQVVAWYEEGRLENAVIKNHIHGQPVYLLLLEFGPRQEVVEWASEYVQAHRDIQFILLNHEYLEAGGGRRTSKLKCVAQFKNTSTTYTTPTQLWERLIKPNDNILCVFCGHVGGLYAFTLDKNDAGRDVPQIQHNIQGAEFRDDYWLMLWEFPATSDSANVSVVNTWTGKYYNDQQVLFKFKYR